MKNLFLSLALLCSMSIFASAPVEKSRVVATQEIIHKDGSKTEIVIVEDEDFVHSCTINRYGADGTIIGTFTQHNVPDNVSCTAVALAAVLTKKI